MRTPIIVAADVTDQANDCRQVEPMLAQTCENLTAVDVHDSVGAFTADAGYFSEANVTAAWRRMNGSTRRILRRAG